MVPIKQKTKNVDLVRASFVEEPQSLLVELDSKLDLKKQHHGIFYNRIKPQ